MNFVAEFAAVLYDALDFAQGFQQDDVTDARNGELDGFVEELIEAEADPRINRSGPDSVAYDTASLTYLDAGRAIDRTAILEDIRRTFGTGPNDVGVRDSQVPDVLSFETRNVEFVRGWVLLSRGWVFLMTSEGAEIDPLARQLEARLAELSRQPDEPS